MKLEADALYVQLRDLVATMPDLARDWAKPEGQKWLGRAAALVEAQGNRADILFLTTATNSLGSTLHQGNLTQIIAIVHRALARAELAAPAGLQGQFIAAGESLSALAAVAKVLARSTRELLIVDAYADSTLFTDFAVTAPAGVLVRVLSVDREARKAELTPVVERWRQQYAGIRPIEVRLTQGASLHDRLIMIDRREAWVAGQSFNGMAQRSHTSILRADDDLAGLKVTAYEAIWASAVPLP